MYEFRLALLFVNHLAAKEQSVMLDQFMQVSVPRDATKVSTPSIKKLSRWGSKLGNFYECSSRPKGPLGLNVSRPQASSCVGGTAGIPGEPKLNSSPEDHDPVTAHCRARCSYSRWKTMLLSPLLAAVAMLLVVFICATPLLVFSFMEPPPGEFGIEGEYDQCKQLIVNANYYSLILKCAWFLAYGIGSYVSCTLARMLSLWVYVFVVCIIMITSMQEIEI